MTQDVRAEKRQLTGQANASPASAKIEPQLHFGLAFAAIAALALLLRNGSQQAAGILVRGQHGVANAGIFALTMPPALAQYPVTDKVLVETDDEVFLLFAPAYYQGAFTLTQSGGKCCSFAALPSRTACGAVPTAGARNSALSPKPACL